MNKFNKDIFNKAKHIKLSQAEKDGMRADFELFIQRHPVRNEETFRHLLQVRSKSNIPTFAEILTLLI